MVGSRCPRRGKEPLAIRAAAHRRASTSRAYRRRTSSGLGHACRCHRPADRSPIAHHRIVTGRVGAFRRCQPSGAIRPDDPAAPGATADAATDRLCGRAQPGAAAAVRPSKVAVPDRRTEGRLRYRAAVRDRPARCDPGRCRAATGRVRRVAAAEPGIDGSPTAGRLGPAGGGHVGGRTPATHHTGYGSFWYRGGTKNSHRRTADRIRRAGSAQQGTPGRQHGAVPAGRTIPRGATTSAGTAALGTSRPRHPATTRDA
jgi:hypothetical protein